MPNTTHPLLTSMDFSLQKSDRKIGKEMRVGSRAEDCLCVLHSLVKGSSLL